MANKLPVTSIVCMEMMEGSGALNPIQVNSRPSIQNLKLIFLVQFTAKTEKKTIFSFSLNCCNIGHFVHYIKCGHSNYVA